jgi:hypothetical protein
MGFIIVFESCDAVPPEVPCPDCDRGPPTPNLLISMLYGDKQDSVPKPESWCHSELDQRTGHLAGEP